MKVASSISFIFQSAFEALYNEIDQCEGRITFFISDDIMPEYIKIFSSLMADNYGAPLTEYPSRNNNPEQIMEGIVNTVFSEMEDSRLFAHVKVILYQDGNFIVKRDFHHANCS